MDAWMEGGRDGGMSNDPMRLTVPQVLPGEKQDSDRVSNLLWDT